MSDEQTQHDQAPAKPSPAQIRQMLAHLPRIRTGLPSDDILKRATRQSERGKLPGFQARPADGLFECAAFGNPFDYRLVATHEKGNESGEVRFEVKIKRKSPAIFWGAMALTVWPGVIFTDSILNTWFGWYPNETWITYAWYLPLTLLPLPWLHKSVMNKTRTAALVHAHEQIQRLAGALDGEVVE
ncbi:MAG: hypothetical protein ACIARQ_17155 [Phycisphaerales bacterium JB061]